MREIRPYFLHGRQNNNIDGRLELEIRKQLALLQQRMVTTGQAFGALKRILSDGTVIVVFASYNGPVPLLRAWVERPPVEQEQGVPAIYLESGFLRVPGSYETPLIVYVGDDINQHISSGGIFLPSDPVNRQYLLTKVVFPPNNACAVWQTTPPGVVDGAYTSRFYLEGRDCTEKLFEELQTPELEWLEPSTITSKYTGLLRLAIQAKLGAGKFITELYPGGWSMLDLDTKAGANGLIFDENWVFWAVRVAPDGITVRQLKWDQRLSCIPQWLNENITDEIKTKLLAWLLSTLTVAPNTEDVVLYTTEEMQANIISYGAPLSYGWHFSRLTNKAAIVLIRNYSDEMPVGDYLRYGKSVQIELSFTFDEDAQGNFNPKVDVSFLQEEVEFKLFEAFFNVWTHNILGYEAFDHSDNRGSNYESNYERFCGNVAALYCYYDKEDELTTLSYWCYCREDIEDIITFGSRFACQGAAGYYRVISPLGPLYSATGGFVVNGSSPQTWYIGSYSDDEYQWSLGDGGGETNYVTNTVNLGQLPVRSFISAFPCGSNSSNPIYDAFYAWAADIFGASSILPIRVKIAYAGPGTGSWTVKNIYSHTIDDICVIPKNDAEAFYLTTLRTVSSMTVDRANATAIFPSPVYGTFGILKDGKWEDYSPIPYNNTLLGSWASGQTTINDITVIEDITDTLGTPSPIPPPDMVTGKIWTSGNKELDMDLTQSVWNDWAPKISLTTFIPGWPILMQSSFGGDSSYVPGDAANKQIVEGYEHVPSQPLIFGRWLGWA